ncbi:hypothetical protein E4T56_gene2245 [Termitomyces sp. T112]|nr:hypothetical protein C0989_005721 [Termitomyces sp. Mn162]KAG5717539.1 hypothetical protein E4T56_gene2245 [Termitomyces sp. T112]
MDASASSASGQHRQKRVLPSRSRRGGPGVGTCDADMMILDTQRRKSENEPLIPAETPFLLTTNSTLASTSSGDYHVNIHAHERYFERPDVLKAYREQLTIETPEFKSMGDTQAGRLRARSQVGTTEEGPVETSDAAYEKRHRKYETFEKRIRLREKEKLKHEQYKLKERMDQLRAMDALAFLSLPDDLFPAPLKQVDPESNDEEESIFGAQVNGGGNYAEGERRRREMLKIAYTLEERYRVLLPPDRTKRPTGQIATEPPLELETQAHVGKGTLTPSDVAPLIETVQKDSERSKLKIKLGARLPNQVNKSSPKPNTSQKGRQSVPPAPKQLAQRKTQMTLEEILTKVTASVETVAEHPSSQIHALSERPLSPPASNTYRPSAILPHQEVLSIPATPMSNPEIAVLRSEPYSPETEVVHDEEHISGSARISTSPNLQEPISVASRPSVPMRPQKRAKLSPAPASLSSRHSTREPSVPPIASITIHQFRHRSPSHASTVQSSRRYGSHAAESERHGLLMTQAIRSAESKTSKGQRHWYAFGGKVQNDLFTEEREFEIPAWVHDIYPHILVGSPTYEKPTTRRTSHSKRKG